MTPPQKSLTSPLRLKKSEATVLTHMMDLMGNCHGWKAALYEG